MMRYGLIAGNGRFPLLTLESAHKLGHEVIAIGIQRKLRARLRNWPRAAIGFRWAS